MVPVSTIVLAGTILLALLASWVLLSGGRRMRPPTGRRPPQARPIARGEAGGGQAQATRTTSKAAGPKEEGGARPLRDADRERYQLAWKHVQSLFIEQPRTGILDADQLIENVMIARGYQLPDRELAIGPLPNMDETVFARYRAGHDVAGRRQDPNVRTEHLWRAMVDYQAVLDALLEPAAPPAVPPSASEPKPATSLTRKVTTHKAS
jgi:hypothetical protein